MTSMTKTLLTVAVTGLALGSFIDLSHFPLNPMWTVALPAGAISLGLFSISLIMEKEVARFDEEEAEKTARARLGRTLRHPKNENIIPQRATAPAQARIAV